MGIIFLLLSAYWMYLIPSAPLTALIWYVTKSRLQWIKWDYLTLVIPFLSWATCFFLWSADKSLSNLGLEPFLLGCCAAISPLSKFLLKGKVNERVRVFVMIVCLSLVGIGLWRWMPGFSE